MNLKVFLFSCLFGVTAICLPIMAEELSRGEITFEARQFNDDHLSATRDSNISLLTKLEQESSFRGLEFRFSAMGRVDQEVPSRSLLMLEDFYLAFYWNEWKFLGGYKKFNWSATEVFHPADVINSRNFDSDLESLEKKGELTFEVQRELGDGAITLFFFPRFESPILPRQESRLGAGVEFRGPQIVDGEQSSTDENWQLQFGGEITQTFGAADISIHFLRHVDRGFSKFGYLSSTDLLSNTSTPVPFYFWAKQFGATYQQALDAFVLKMEMAHRIFEGHKVLVGFNTLETLPNHTDIALGGEYLWELGGGEEVTFLLEGQYTIGPTKEERLALQYFQSDIFFGVRFAFNDVMNKELYASIILDLEYVGEKLITFSYSQRISNEWKINTGIRYIDADVNASSSKGLGALDNDGHLYLNLTRYF